MEFQRSLESYLGDLSLLDPNPQPHYPFPRHVHPPSTSSPFAPMPLLPTTGLNPYVDVDPYLSYQKQMIELKNQIRAHEALLARMGSPLARRVHHQSVGPQSRTIQDTQYRNFSNGDACSFCNGCSGARAHEYSRRGSNSIRGYPNRSLLCSERQNTGFGNSAHRRFRMPASMKNLSLESLRGWIVELAKDKEGGRFLQKKFEEGAVNDIHIIFSELEHHICELMVDPFGNYLVQKIIELCSEEQRTRIIKSATKNKYEFISICLDTHGTRVVQKLLEHLTTPHQMTLATSALMPGTIDLVNDVNGHHVIERCYLYFTNEYIKCLSDAIADHCLDVAMHQHGCCVLQKCLGRSEGEQRERLVDEIIANAQLLSQDQFGNYVVQYVLDLKIPHFTAKLLRKLEGTYASLSMQKFSSNVVERCLKESEKEQCTRIIKELLESPHAVLIMQNAYGNYVIQSALAISKGPIHAAIVNLVTRELPILSSHPYGKRVVEKSLVLRCTNQR